MEILAEVQRFLPSTESESDKWHLLQLIIVFNGIIGVGLLLSSFSVGTAWGFGAWMQLFVTSVCHLAYCVYLFNWIKAQEMDKTDFLGGVAVMMNLQLFLTASLWSSLSGTFTGNDKFCELSGVSGEGSASAFATVLVIGHLLLSGLVMRWREHLRLGFNSDLYTHIGSHGSNDDEAYEPAMSAASAATPILREHTNQQQQRHSLSQSIGHPDENDL